jgi:hypothetical protein
MHEFEILTRDGTYSFTPKDRNEYDRELRKLCDNARLTMQEYALCMGFPELRHNPGATRQ